MGKVSIEISDHPNGIFLSAAHLFEGRVHLSVPEFHGTLNGKTFAVRQVISHEVDPASGSIAYRLDSDPAELGMHYEGHIAPEGEDHILFTARVDNHHDSELRDAHHTIVVDLSEAPDLQDPKGERTYLYTETGWASLAELSGSAGQTVNKPFHVGASYNATTVIWRLLARFDPEGKNLLAIGLNKGYAFASDHPDWGSSLVAGCRWGHLPPEDYGNAEGRLYLLQGTLDDLRERYVRDFK